MSDDRAPTEAELAELMPLLEQVFVDWTNEVEGKSIHLDNDMLIYQENGKLFLEWPDGFVISKPLSLIGDGS